MVGNPVGAHRQNQGTPPDDDTAVLADNANWAANNPTRAGCTSDAYKRLKAVSFSSEMIDQIGGWSKCLSDNAVEMNSISVLATMR